VGNRRERITAEGTEGRKGSGDYEAGEKRIHHGGHGGHRGRERGRGKSKDYAEVTESAEVEEKGEEKPKTQAHTPCLGHPARSRRHGEEKNREVRKFVFSGRPGD
jgi:hypothetical protein